MDRRLKSGGPRRSGTARTAAGLALVLALAGCARAGSTPGPAVVNARPVPVTVAITAAKARCRRTIVAAGDMNGRPATRATGRLAKRLHPDVVAVLGDQQYPTGSLADYRRKYATSGWGDLKPITRPVPGNHEYRTPGAAGYFAYFGHPRPYYAYHIGCGWRGYALNSEVGLAAEARWLRRDLAAHPTAHVMAYWHRPRFTSGTEHGSDPSLQVFWNALAGRSGVVLNGHEHNYERFARIGGMREFVVGTAGSSTYPFRAVPVRGSLKRIAHTPGVLRLRLRPGYYRWSFRNAANHVLDRGRST